MANNLNDNQSSHGGLRAKSFAFSGIVLSILFISFSSNNPPLRYSLFAFFCLAAIIVGIMVARNIWMLKSGPRSRRNLLWGISAVAVVIALEVLDDTKLFVWNKLYLWVPIAIISSFEAIGAWYTESRKSIHIYYENGLVFVPASKSEIKSSVKDKIIRNLISFLALIFFIILIIGSIVAALWTDKLFGFFEILPTWSTWRDNFFVLFLVSGASLTLWAVAQFVNVNGLPVTVIFPPSKLVTTGLYSYTRNPMLLGVFIGMLGLGFAINSVSFVCIFLPLFALINFIELKLVEEPQLEKYFGVEYAEYKLRVPRFLPYRKR